jgi:hypothetical protein
MSKPDWMILEEEILAGYTWENIARLMLENRATVSPRYWLRFAYALGVVSVSTPFRIHQRRKLAPIVRETTLEQDPVFVIGHYRTGTTYLITTLSKDPARSYVSNLLAYTFSMYFAIPGLARRLMDASLPEKRPMDNVPMSSDEPAEEEYCVGSFSKYSYYHGMVFPKRFEEMAKYHSFEGLPEDAERWKRYYDYVVKALTHQAEGRQLFLKNPANAFRIEQLLELYPNAKFIHTYRNPYTLYTSNMKYYRKVVPLYTLQTFTDEMIEREVLSLYRGHMEAYERTKSLVPEGNLIEVRYEDFIEEPMPFMERIYEQFQLDGWEQARAEFQRHFDKQRSYETNRFEISDEVIRTVNEHWDWIRELQGYARLEPKAG